MVAYCSINMNSLLSSVLLTAFLIAQCGATDIEPAYLSRGGGTGGTVGYEKIEVGIQNQPLYCGYNHTDNTAWFLSSVRDEVYFAVNGKGLPLEVVEFNRSMRAHVSECGDECMKAKSFDRSSLLVYYFLGGGFLNFLARSTGSSIVQLVYNLYIKLGLALPLFGWDMGLESLFWNI